MIDPPKPVSPHPALGAVKLLCCDVDGVLTDGGLFFDKDGLSMLRFHVQDGIGLKRLMRADIRTCFISQSENQVIRTRAAALGIDYCFTGVENKLYPITELASGLGLRMEEVCHIADDINDLTLLEAVGVPVTVPAGVAEVRRVCRFVTRAPGGAGAVRELCEAILTSRSAGMGASIEAG
jgi:3-deoxy-D-manno-octulosonate 8-phosphate phosphatase (KDO 8-P phosphatase)